MYDIREFRQYLRDVNNLRRYELCRTKLVVDGLAFSNFINTRFVTQAQYHGSNLFLATKMEEYLEAFRKCRIEPLFVINGNGLGAPSEREINLDHQTEGMVKSLVSLKEMAQKVEDADELEHRQYFHGHQNLLFYVLTRNKIPFVTCNRFLGWNACHALAAYLDCPILTSSKLGPFVAHSFRPSTGYKLIFMGDIKMPPDQNVNGIDHFITCRSYCPAYSQFKELDNDMLPLLAAFLVTTFEQDNELMNRVMRHEVPPSCRPVAVKRPNNYQESPITKKVLALVEFLLQSKKTKQEIVGELVSSQPCEERVKYMIFLHKLFLEVYCPSFRYATALVTLFKLIASPRLNRTNQRNVFEPATIAPNHYLEIVSLVSGERPFPISVKRLAYLGMESPLESLEMNPFRLCSALYSSRARLLNIRLEDYGTLPSVNNICVKLRQIVCGMFLDLSSKKQPESLRGFKSEQSCVEEIISEFGELRVCSLRLNQIDLLKADSFVTLMNRNNDVNFIAPVLMQITDPCALGMGILTAYWSLHTGTSAENRASIRTAFTVVACVTTHLIRAQNGPGFQQLLNTYDTYASQLKQAASSKALNMQVSHAISELSYLQPYFVILKELAPMKNCEVDFPSTCEMFPHGRLVYWMATHENSRTNHISNLMSLFECPIEKVTETVTNAIRVCDALLALNKDLPAFDPINENCYVKVTKFEEGEKAV